MLGGSGSSLDPLFAELARLQRAWPGGGWSWDGRLLCVASSFDKEIAREARSAASLALPIEWRSATIRDAPSIVREIAETAGGVRSDQLLLCTEPVVGVIAFGLWWPWNDESTTSLRVGLAGRATERDQERFRDMFGASVG